MKAYVSILIFVQLYAQMLNLSLFVPTLLLTLPWIIGKMNQNLAPFVYASQLHVAYNAQSGFIGVAIAFVRNCRRVISQLV